MAIFFFVVLVFIVVLSSKLPGFSVRRPIMTIMVFVGISLLGLLCWFKLPQELYPPITYPQLSVVTFYKDAAPEEMEILITKPAEEAVGTVSGVRKISSISKEEVSLVMAEFNWGTNMDFAAMGVREKIDLIKESLPRGSEDPIVMKYNPFELPVMVLNISAKNTSPAELRSVVNKIIKNELEKAEGVAAAEVTGGLIPEILIEINQDRLMSKGLALNKVVEFISKANLNYPAGTIEESFYEYLIRTMGEFKVIKEVGEVVVGIDEREKKDEFGSRGGIADPQAKRDQGIKDSRLILLKDIGTVKSTFKDKTSISRYNGKDNITVSIQKQADAHTLWVANSVKEIVSQLKKMVPKDVRIDIITDQSQAIRTNIQGVRDAALQGGILAFLVLLLFLRNVRSAAIVALNIPLSIIAVFSFMLSGGITLNMISLGGLALGVGMLVDNSIVVVENIYRHRQEEKKDAKEGSVYGATEVSAAITGSTLTTLAVFLPMAFVFGIAGQICNDLSWTVAASLLISLALALTLTPIAICFLVKKIPGVIAEESQDLIGRFIGTLQEMTHNVLVFFLDHKALCLGVVGAIFVVSCLLFPVLDTELLPKVDQGQFIVKLDLPPGTRLEFTDTVSQRIESYILEMREVKGVTVNIGSTKEKKGTALLETRGPNQAQLLVNLKPLARLGKSGEGYRTIPTSDVVQKLEKILKPQDLSGAHIEYILQESPFQSALQAGAPVVIEVKGQDLAKLKGITDDVEKKLKSIPGIYSIRNTLTDPAPEVKISVFKKKAATFNISTSDIAVTAQTAIKGYLATKFKEEGEEIDIRVRLRKQDRDNMPKVRRLEMQSPLGINVPLAELAYFSVGKGPTEIKRKDQERVVIVTANIFKRSFKKVTNSVASMLKGLKMPVGYSAELTGEKEQIQDSFRSLRNALILSILLVFMIMASQFESLWQPFVILFTVPLSIIGVILILFLTATPISIMVLLGVIVLGGLVVNNGIVLVDYTNVLKKEGMSSYDAVLAASRRRLRPIIMTALTTIFGLVPLALALNEGASLQQPMAIAVIGGLAVSTFFSLVVIPTVYMGLEDIRSYIAIRRGKKPPPPPREIPPPKPGPDKEGPGPKQKAPIEEAPEIDDEDFKQKEEKIEYEEEVEEDQASKEEKPEPYMPEEEPLEEEPKPIIPEEDIRPPVIEPDIPKEEELAEEDIEIDEPEEEKLEEEKPVEEPKEEIKEEPIELGPPPKLPKEEKPIEPVPPPTKVATKLKPTKKEKIQKLAAPKAPKKPVKKIKPKRGKIRPKLWDSLADRQQELIAYLRQNKRITRKQYAEDFDVSVPTAARDLKYLLKKRILKAKGPAAIGRYYMLK
ncbi:MAG: efflux RND transporter permease subunit [Candidatus Omnitrophica bacterium]|nr:efflux RND transporter permease subunit [Candidatus Omnitrophota bacterium]